MPRRISGYINGVVAAAAYGMNPLFALPLYSDGMSPNSVLLLRYFFATAILAIMIRSRNISFALSRHEAVSLAALGLLMGFSSFGLFESYTYMEASIASTMLFIYPMMVAVIMIMFYHERLTLHTTLCLAAALGGIILLYNGKPGATLNIVGATWVILSALAYAVCIVWLNRPTMRAIPPVKVSFYMIAFGIVIFAVRALLTHDLSVPTTPLTWGCILGLGLLPTAVSLICTAAAAKEIGATATAILGVFEPVTAVIFGVLIFHERLTALDIAGMILIMVAVISVIAGESATTQFISLLKHSTHRRQ